MIVREQNLTVTLHTLHVILPWNLAGITGSDLKISQNIHLMELHGFLQIYYMKTYADTDFQTSGLLNRRFMKFLPFISLS